MAFRSVSTVSVDSVAMWFSLLRQDAGCNAIYCSAHSHAVRQIKVGQRSRGFIAPLFASAPDLIYTGPSVTVTAALRDRVSTT